MRSSDIVPKEGADRRSRALKLFLDYAETGRLGEGAKLLDRDPDNDFEGAVIEGLRELNFDCAPQVIVAVPNPSAVASTIWARQTCFCGLLRSSTLACRRLRSVGLRWTVMPVRIPKTRTAEKPWESHTGLLRQLQSTRLSGVPPQLHS